jgi:hypothetical protein
MIMMMMMMMIIIIIINYNITSDMSTINSKHQNSCNTVFPRDMVCLRNISVDTLHIGDTEDNSNNRNWVTVFGSGLATG